MKQALARPITCGWAMHRGQAARHSCEVMSRRIRMRIVERSGRDQSATERTPEYQFGSKADTALVHDAESRTSFQPAKRTAAYAFARQASVQLLCMRVYQTRHRLHNIALPGSPGHRRRTST